VEKFYDYGVTNNGRPRNNGAEEKELKKIFKNE
jgi:hypothetical protein